MKRRSGIFERFFDDMYRIIHLYRNEAERNDRLTKGDKREYEYRANKLHWIMEIYEKKNN